MVSALLWFHLFQSEDEREMCSRTIYCTNIDKKVLQDLRFFTILLQGWIESFSYLFLQLLILPSKSHFLFIDAGYSSRSQTLL